jgi:hypothetical protein
LPAFAAERSAVPVHLRKDAWRTSISFRFRRRSASMSESRSGTGSRPARPSGRAQRRTGTPASDRRSCVRLHKSRGCG